MSTHDDGSLHVTSPDQVIELIAIFKRQRHVTTSEVAETLNGIFPNVDVEEMVLETVITHCPLSDLPFWCQVNDALLRLRE